MQGGARQCFFAAAFAFCPDFFVDFASLECAASAGPAPLSFSVAEVFAVLALAVRVLLAAALRSVFAAGAISFEPKILARIPITTLRCLVSPLLTTITPRGFLRIVDASAN